MKTPTGSSHDPLLRPGGTAPLVAILERQIAEAIRACRLARSVADGKLDPGEAHEQIAEIEHRGDALRGKPSTRLADDARHAHRPRGPLSRSRAPSTTCSTTCATSSASGTSGTSRPTTRIWACSTPPERPGDLRLAVRTIARDPTETSPSALAVRSPPTRSAASTTSSSDGSSAASPLWRLQIREFLRRLDVVGLRLNEAAYVLSDAAVKRRA